MELACSDAHEAITQNAPLVRRVSGGRYATASDRQCTATRKDGERCERPPIRGGTVCVLHGGDSPLARRSAQRMLLSLVEPALTTLAAALDACDGNGDPVWPSRVAAAKTLLSRAGMGESATLQLEKRDHDLGHLDKRALADELENLSRQLRENAAIDVTPRPQDEHPEVDENDDREGYDPARVPFNPDDTTSADL